jgi:beta-lactamase superfamily II metal-dependent hydrolase
MTGRCASARPLEVHYINVGQGASTLIRGPLGTTLLYDFGDINDGQTIVEYLASIGITRGKSIDYAVLSHRHQDHVYGYADIVEAGVGFKRANYDRVDEAPGPKTRTATRYYRAAATTEAGEVQGLAPGSTIDLGCGAEIFVAAANGVRFDDVRIGPKNLNENDKSISLLIRYGDFSMTLDGDIGSGGDDCADHDTVQARMQPVIMQGLIEAGYVDADVGVDVIHIAHHGSDSSTSAEYFDLARPEVGLISVGVDNKNEEYGHPRASVVESVLIGPNRPGCIVAPPLRAVYQTEDGLDDPDHRYQQLTSNEGISAGDIVLTTDGAEGYWVRGTNRVTEGTNAEFVSDHVEGTFYAFDEAGLSEFMALVESGPFFDAQTDTRNTKIPQGEQHDMTPQPPELSAFDRALLEICGDLSSPIPDAETALIALLSDDRFKTERDELTKRLAAVGITFGDVDEMVVDISVLWTAAHGFEHVFCGELSGGNRIGGLHYVGRYLDLQEKGQASLPHQGQFEIIPGRVYTMPVIGNCRGRPCSSPKKGYGLDQDAIDVLFHGIHAWSQMNPAGRADCRYDYPGGYSGVFVFKQGGIRTMYPVVRPDPSQPACQRASAESAVFRAAPPSTEAQCGE